jgi:hypothetical protein
LEGQHVLAGRAAVDEGLTVAKTSSNFSGSPVTVSRLSRITIFDSPANCA